MANSKGFNARQIALNAVGGAWVVISATIVSRYAEAIEDFVSNGGAAQGIGTAMYEEVQYDASGQPNVSTFADYVIPGATELPSFRMVHMETPSPYTKFGVKGMGEGGAIAPPAAIFNAVNDALQSLGVEVNETPLTPRRLLEAIQRAKASAGELA